MIRYWLEKLKESFISVLPIYCVVLLVFLLSTFGVWVFADFSDTYIITWQQFLVFTLCTIMVAVGLALFNHGADESMNKIGRLVADSVMKKRKMWLIVFMTIILGTAATIAEPDLNVVAEELSSAINSMVLLVVIGLGVGIFFAFGVIRIIFNKSLFIMYLAFYGMTLALAGICDPNLLPLCFDGGGIPTGAVTVPFVLAFGIGVAASKSGGYKGEDSFGLIGLCSIGPVILMMFLTEVAGVDLTAIAYHIPDVGSSVGEAFSSALLDSLRMVAVAISPLTLIFIIYDVIVLKLPPKQLARIFIGLAYVFVGLVGLFTGVYGGFMPIAYKVGMGLGNADLLWVAILLVFFFGMFGVLAEPAVLALCQAVEQVSEGTVKKTTVLLVMAFAVGIADMLHIIRSYYQFNIMYLLVPLYIVAIGLGFLVPKIYIAIAFDSSGTSSGPMTAAFVLPFCIGFSYCVLENQGQSTNLVYIYGFGLCAMMSAVVPIAIEMIGVYVIVKQKRALKRARARIVEPDDEQIIHFNQEAAL
ncbi:MAG: DUF1538 domain-containing protein [Bacillota bacterium]|nr:DUF1538 domain-containing protein [Bacillota bacterium]